MASRITPAMARGIAQKWGGLKGDADYYRQPEAVRARLGRFAKTMGYTTNQPRTMGRSYDRAAYGHMSKLAQATPQQEKNILNKQYMSAYQTEDKMFRQNRADKQAQQAIRRTSRAEKNLTDFMNRGRR